MLLAGKGREGGMDGAQAMEMEGIWWEKDGGREGETGGTERGRGRERGRRAGCVMIRGRENPSVGKGLAAVICGEPR